jgi:PAS domain-containing protein
MHDFGNTLPGRHVMTSKQLKAATAESAPPVGDGLPPSIHPQVFQHTVNQADMAISITDVQGNILYVNPAFTRVTGYASAEAIGQNQSMLSNHRPCRASSTRSCGRRFRVASPGRPPGQPAQGRQQVPRRAEHLAGGQFRPARYSTISACIATSPKSIVWSPR